ILIEHTKQAYIVGIGLNAIKLPSSNYPFIATSLEEECGMMVDYRDVLQSLITVLNTQLNHRETWYDDYISHSFVIGKTMTYDAEKYTILAINRDGQLVLNNQNNTISLTMNEVSLEDLYYE
ncbi:MAG: hypothetical protein V2J89_17230, partial [Halieaceae bacterium]|nr:hypothetical protein [Halieaceae bacterium]